MPWWGLVLIILGSMSFGACFGLLAFALIHAAGHREDN